MPVAEILDAVRVVATPEALDTARLPAASPLLRIAPDELLVVGNGEVVVDDPHAIVTADDGWAAVELPRPEAEEWLSREAEWHLPAGSPVFAQGLAAGLAVKVWANHDRALVVVAASLAHELESRL